MTMSEAFCRQLTAWRTFDHNHARVAAFAEES
jgi:hypothetical protein